MKIQIPAILDRYNRRKDRSYTITFVSGLEMTKQERDDIDEAWQQEGWLVFVPNDLKEVEVPKEKAEVGIKSPTQRLYNILYVWWKQDYEGNVDFDKFRKGHMENFIDQIKDKLE